MASQTFKKMGNISCWCFGNPWEIDGIIIRNNHFDPFSLLAENLQPFVVSAFAEILNQIFIKIVTKNRRVGVLR